MLMLLIGLHRSRSHLLLICVAQLEQRLILQGVGIILIEDVELALGAVLQLQLLRVL